ncbi:MAG: uracil-DNA glycosylase [Treponema sp.]|nr:uracil-DNA glycosylase [Treponema sp.]
MTAEEKTVLARFLDCTGDYLAGGYVKDREPCTFEDEHTALPSGPGDLSSLPLAYQMDEEGEDWENRASPAEEAGNSTMGESLDDLASAIAHCSACGLAAARTHPVPGEGAERPLVMVIGEGPGADEDASGRPFVGKAGQLLDKMLASIGLSRDTNCYIANMVKCRPPENRDPEPGEIAACYPFLERQIALLRPQVILCAGRVAAQALLKTGQSINALRGTFADFNTTTGTIPVLCTFHPSALLRDETLKRPAWEDLKLLKSHLALED